VSSVWNNFNSDTCIPDPTLSYSGLGYPQYVVNATSAGDVAAGVIVIQTKYVMHGLGAYLARHEDDLQLFVYIHYYNFSIEVRSTSILSSPIITLKQLVLSPLSILQRPNFVSILIASEATVLTS
jgi:hypothetical protein